MSGANVYNWIKAIVALALLALIGFLIWKLLSLFGALPKFFQGTGILGMPSGNVADSGKMPSPGQSNGASTGTMIGPNAASGIKLDDALRADRRSNRGFWTEENPFAEPLRILITGGGNLPVE